MDAYFKTFSYKKSIRSTAISTAEEGNMRFSYTANQINPLDYYSVWKIQNSFQQIVHMKILQNLTQIKIFPYRTSEDHSQDINQKSSVHSVHL